MAQKRNLELDVERVFGAEVARIYVVQACSYTKGVGAPTITDDCPSYAEFEAEVERLRRELDEALREAKARFGGGPERPEPAASAGSEVERAAPPAEPQRPAGELRVRDLMTREVKTLRPEDKLSLAEELMKVGGFRHVVIVDEGDEVVGVVSHRDIVYGVLSWTLGEGRHAHAKTLERIAAKEIMQRNVATVGPEVALSEAAGRMRERVIGCLPVVDSDRLIGILTEGDLLAYLARGGAA